MDCTNLSSDNGSVCTGTVIPTGCFPQLDEFWMNTWLNIFGTKMWGLANANPNMLICLKCGGVYPLPEKESLVWDREVCPI